MKRSARWLGERRLVVAVGLVVSLPVIVSTVTAVRAGWVPVFDDAIVATNAFDAFSSHARLVGVYSDASLPAVGPVYNAGPLLLWLLAPATHLLGDRSLPVMAGLVNTASIMGVVALARRRGGNVFMFATALALLVMCRSFPAGTFYAILNASIALLPFTLLLFLAWSLACGEYRLLPLTALVASFVLQSHVSLAVPALAAAAVGLGGYAVVAFGSRDRQAPGRGNPRPWLLGALAVTVVCWAAPVIDQLENDPGNFARLLDTATTSQKTFGLEPAWHTLVRATGIPPWWMTRDRFGAARVFDVFGSPGAIATISCVVVLAGLAVAGVLGIRRRRADVMAAAALALALSAVVALSVASTPSRLWIFAAKATQTGQVVGMFAWLALGWAVAVLATSMSRWPLSAPALVARARGSTVAAAPALLALGLVAVVFASNRPPDSKQDIYRPVRAISDRLSAHIPRREVVLVSSAEKADAVRAYALYTALVYQLRKRGIHPVVSEKISFANKFGPYYSKLRNDPDAQLVIDDRYRPTLPDARLVGRAWPTREATPGFPHYRPVTVSLAPIRVCPPPSHPAPRPVRSIRGVHIARSGIMGLVDRSKIVAGKAEFCGWAANTIHHRAVEAVALVSGGRLVAAVKPADPRPDVPRGVPGVHTQNVGFSLEVPAHQLASRRRKTQVLAIDKGDAAPLTSTCVVGKREVAC